MRTFIAVDLRTTLIEDVLEEIKGTGAAIKTVAPENLHLTLKFLGEVSEGRIHDIHGAMEVSMDAFGPFEVSLKGMGVFPSMNYMKVVWAGIDEGRGQLIYMQKALEDTLSGIGFKREEKAFSPHLTLGRVKGPKGKEDLKGFLEAGSNRDFGTVKIEKIDLKESVLTPRGPIYSNLREVIL